MRASTFVLVIGLTLSIASAAQPQMTSIQKQAIKVRDNYLSAVQENIFSRSEKFKPGFSFTYYKIGMAIGFITDVASYFAPRYSSLIQTAPAILSIGI